VETPRQYTWDGKKRAINLRNHGTDFAAAKDFDWTTALAFEDRRHDYGERRFVAYGKIASALYVLIWTPRDETVRIISLRKANGREIHRYEVSQT
jgi:hypothetical protein